MLGQIRITTILLISDNNLVLKIYMEINIGFNKKSFYHQIFITFTHLVDLHSSYTFCHIFPVKTNDLGNAKASDRVVTYLH